VLFLVRTELVVCIPAVSFSSFAEYSDHPFLPAFMAIIDDSFNDSFTDKLLKIAQYPQQS